MTWRVGGVLALAACGGIAVIDGDGQSDVEGRIGDETSSSSSSTVGFCAEACEVISHCTTLDDVCVERCTEIAPGCASLRDEFLDCFVAGTYEQHCTMPAACAERLTAMLDCEGRDPWGPQCHNQQGVTCSCTEYWTKGGTAFTATCQGGKLEHCECFVDDELVGKCRDAEGHGCGPLSGCCASSFFIPR